MRLETGAWLTPTIQLLRLIDEGAMGSVWAADHLGLGTEVAVKLVNEAHAKDRAVRRRLAAEARAAARIKSPHVVQILDVAETEDGTPFIVMELLEGDTLRRRLDRGVLLEPGEAALVVMQACRALHGAHQLGIVHRDIKPDNLFLLADDDALFLKILDFGIAKGLTKGITEPGLILGTPVYLCRELITDRKSDYRCDLWAVTVCAYEMLTGFLPFDGHSLDEVFAAIWRGKFTPPSELNGELTPEVDAWFEQALCKERQERPATAKALAATFVQAVATVGDDLAPTSQEDWRISRLSLLGFQPPPRGTFSSSPPRSSSPPISRPVLASQHPSSSPGDSAPGRQTSPTSSYPPVQASEAVAPPSTQPSTMSAESGDPRRRFLPAALAFGASAALVGGLVSGSGNAHRLDPALAQVATQVAFGVVSRAQEGVAASDPSDERSKSLAPVAREAESAGDESAGEGLAGEGLAGEGPGSASAPDALDDVAPSPSPKPRTTAPAPGTPKAPLQPARPQKDLGF